MASRLSLNSIARGNNPLGRIVPGGLEAGVGYRTITEIDQSLKTSKFIEDMEDLVSTPKLLDLRASSSGAKNLAFESSDRRSSGKMSPSSTSGEGTNERNQLWTIYNYIFETHRGGLRKNQRTMSRLESEDFIRRKQFWKLKNSGPLRDYKESFISLNDWDAKSILHLTQYSSYGYTKDRGTLRFSCRIGAILPNNQCSRWWGMETL